MSEKGLGRGPGAGLGALFGRDSLSAEDGEVQMLPLSKIEPKQDQPRAYFDEAALQELADSLKQHGFISPITVRKLNTGYYQIIAGERRWRAARLAGINEVPVRVLIADDRRAAELALVENLQREDLNPIEEARGYKSLMEEYGMTQEQAAQSVGKSRPAVTNSLRLLSLDSRVLDHVEQGKLSAGHARALLAVKNQQAQFALAAKVIKQGLSVRQTESLSAKTAKEDTQTEQPEIVPEYSEIDYFGELESKLTSALGRRVRVDRSLKRGKIEIEYYSSDDLDALIRAIFSLNENGLDFDSV